MANDGRKPPGNPTHKLPTPSNGMQQILMLLSLFEKTHPQPLSPAMQLAHITTLLESLLQAIATLTIEEDNNNEGMFGKSCIFWQRS